MGHIFISHMEDDAELAAKLAEGIELAGYETWYSDRDSIPGGSYSERIRRAVEGASALVVILSPGSLKSAQIKSEILLACKDGKPLLPLLRGVKHAEIENSGPEWESALGSASSVAIPADGISKILPRVVAGLNNLGRPETPTREPARAAPPAPPPGDIRPAVETSGAARPGFRGALGLLTFALLAPIAPLLLGGGFNGEDRAVVGGLFGVAGIAAYGAKLGLRSSAVTLAAATAALAGFALYQTAPDFAHPAGYANPEVLAAGWLALLFFVSAAFAVSTMRLGKPRTREDFARRDKGLWAVMRLQAVPGLLPVVWELDRSSAAFNWLLAALALYGFSLGMKGRGRIGAAALALFAMFVAVVYSWSAFVSEPWAIVLVPAAAWWWAFWAAAAETAVSRAP